TVLGPGNILITNMFTWTSGNMGGPGRTVIEPTGVATLRSASTKGLDAGRTLENKGLIEWSGGDLNLNSGSSGGSGRFENLGTGVLKVSFNAHIHAAGYSDRGSPPPRLVNVGQIDRIAGTGVFYVDVPLEHTGLLGIETGTVRLRDG